MKRVIKSRWSGAKLAPHQKFETMSHLVDCTLVAEKKKKNIVPPLVSIYISNIIRGIVAKIRREINK